MTQRVLDPEEVERFSPPLRSLDEEPMHSQELETDEAWACDIDHLLDRESPVYDWRCPSCVDAAESLVAFDGGEERQEWRATPDAEPKLVDLEWLVARARFWLEHAP